MEKDTIHPENQRHVITSHEHQTETTVSAPPQKEREVAKLTAGGFGFETLLGAGAVVLGILGLVGVLPLYMAAISAIGLGGAFLIESGVFGAALSKARSYESRRERTVLGSGVTIQALAGATGVVLGILALIGFAELPLLAISAIVFGGSLLISSGPVREVEELAPRGDVSYRVEQVENRTVEGSIGLRILAGIGAAVLGILALTGTAPQSLVLVGMLTVGAAAFMTGAAVTARMGSGLR